MIKAQKGTKDILPEESALWQKMESAALEVFQNANCKEIRTPIFEATELFARGVGEGTDIVSKEMYTFEKSDRSITLRPENTAGVVRAYIENGMHRVSPPVKLFYHGPMFRYERPQAGRQRQFNQMGVEIFGVKESSADAEAILLAVNYLQKLGLDDLEVELNSLGCDNCRPIYKENLKKAINKNLELLCDDCKMRYEKNPLRILDCKVESCQKILQKKEIQNAIYNDFICEECDLHFKSVQENLDALNIKYKLNKLLVRGLDYYNRTVFEIKSNNLGSQNAVCGGGRYDKLVEMLDGTPTPAVGWAMGLERLFTLLKDKHNQPQKLFAYIVSTNTIEAIKLANTLRSQGKSVDFDFTGKKFSKQLEKAAKLSDLAIIIGEDELKSDTLTVKNLKTGMQEKVERKEFLNNL